MLPVFVQHLDGAVLLPVIVIAVVWFLEVIR